MAKLIRPIHDYQGNNILPITSTSAIFDSNGNRLDKILDGFGISLDQFEDFELKEDNTKIDPPPLQVALNNMRSGQGVSNLLSYVKASLLGLKNQVDSLGIILEEKNKAIKFHSKKELDDWLSNHKSLLSIGDLLLTTTDKDYWWNGENIEVLKTNISQSDIDKWNSILKESKEYTDKLYSTILNIEIKIVDNLPDIGDSNIIYLLRNSNSYDEYVYISSQWHKLSTISLNLSNIYTKEEIDILLANINNHIDNSDIHISKEERDKLSNCKESDSNSFSMTIKGWYRIAEFDGYTNILKYGSLANGCNILIRESQNNNYSETYDIDFICTSSRKQFILNNKSTPKIKQSISYIRNTYDTENNKSYIEIYYDLDTPNTIYIELNNIVSKYGYDIYKWYISETIQGVNEIEDNLVEVCRLDLSNILDINSRIQTNESKIKSMTSMLNQIISGGTGDITITGGVTEEQLEELKETIFEETFPVGSYSFQSYPIGVWQKAMEFRLEDDNNIIIYRRIL